MSDISLTSDSDESMTSKSDDSQKKSRSKKHKKKSSHKSKRKEKKHEKRKGKKKKRDKDREKCRRKKHKKQKESKDKPDQVVEPDQVVIDEQDIGPRLPPNLPDTSQKFAPMSKEQYEAKQKEVKRVFDQESGRYRLVRGTGEILEEIVSKERHKEINKQATLGDGQYFQSVLAKK